MHPFIFGKRRSVIDFCDQAGIAVACYSPLTKGARLDDPRLEATARKYGRSTAQILIRWGLHKGFITLPKSSNFERIGENANVYDFDIASDEMDFLDALDEGYSCTWDPSDAP